MDQSEACAEPATGADPGFQQPDYWREQAELWARKHFLDIGATEDLLDLIESIVGQAGSHGTSVAAPDKINADRHPQ